MWSIARYCVLMCVLIVSLASVAWDAEFVNPRGAIFSHEIRRSYIRYEISRLDMCYNNDTNLDYIHIYYYASRRDTRCDDGCNLVENTV